MTVTSMQAALHLPYARLYIFSNPLYYRWRLETTLRVYIIVLS